MFSLTTHEQQDAFQVFKEKTKEDLIKPSSTRKLMQKWRKTSGTEQWHLQGNALDNKNKNEAQVICP